MRRAVISFLLLIPTVVQGQPAHIASTPALTPEQERATFKVPTGFEVQLVASEPDIQKPIQIALDSRGRLWAATSHQYPFPAETGKGTDKLFVLSDFGPDGKARKVETFASNLNIPIGVLPLPDEKSCLVSECGRILKLTDTNNDGKADKTEVLYSGFGYEDTHGMTNSFLQMPDGWIYATHGFKNTSKVKGQDGHEITMNSGNTYRFKLDGSRIEVVTRGQVNPFGLTCDPWLNLYTADCHSKPITQLIRGATYQSFGKPHDGLGFAPHVTIHDHGSTALCGLAWYDADHFPAEYRGTMFLGNVVTNRINFDRIEWKGATPIAKELPDFLVSSDPWFRPTDIKLGPDGALYFADFYNPIIGHYEVKLDHPKRDKDRGRVWRIVWKGKDEKGKLPPMPEARTAAKIETLVKDLYSQNIVVRMNSYHELSRRLQADPKLSILSQDHFADPALNSPFELTKFVGMLAFLDATYPGRGIMPANVPTILKNAGDAKPEEMQQFSGLILRAVAMAPTWNAELRAIIAGSMKTFQASPRMMRAMLDGITLHPHGDFVPPLLEYLPTIPADDTHMKYAARVALRGCMKESDSWTKDETLSATGKAQILEMALAIPGANSATFVAKNFASVRPEDRQTAGEFVARYGSTEDWKHLFLAQDQLKGKTDGAKALSRIQVFQAFLRGLQAAGKPIDTIVRLEGKDAVSRSFSRLTQTQEPTVLREGVRALGFWLSIDNSKAGVSAISPFSQDLQDYLRTPSLPIDAQYEATTVLNRINPDLARVYVQQLAANDKLPFAFRENIHRDLLTKPTIQDCNIAKVNLKSAPYSLALVIGTGLAADAFGADLLLATIKLGEAPARLLQEPVVLEKLKASKVRDLDARVAELTKGLPSPDARLAELIKKRAVAYPRARTNAKLGQQVFTKQCAICHQLGGQGAKVGPQLDGIGIRGLERLLEDTLDPNRHVDAAFRATTFTLLDGRTLTGLVLREEGEVSILADANGKEVRIAKKDIDKRTTSLLSAMPANIDTLIPELDYFHLLAYLLQQKPSDIPKK